MPLYIQDVVPPNMISDEREAFKMMTKTLKKIDCGKTCGIYLIVLGALQIPSWFGTEPPYVVVNPTPLLFFLAGYYLIKHNNIARRFVLGTSTIMVILTLLIASLIPLAGGFFTVDLPFYDQRTSSLAVAYLILFGALIVTLIPILLLYNDKARQEFIHPSES